MNQESNGTSRCFAPEMKDVMAENFAEVNQKLDLIKVRLEELSTHKRVLTKLEELREYEKTLIDIDRKLAELKEETARYKKAVGTSNQWEAMGR